MRVEGNSNLEPVHVNFVVGEKYTLLKAIGTVRIGGRVVRESLIDKSTPLECGGCNFVLHPHGKPAVSSATQDHKGVDPFSESRDSNAVFHAPAMGPSPMVEELRNELVELRSAFAGMQDRFYAFSDNREWERRIEDLANKSLSAIEEDLGQRIREPLREEVVSLCQEQKQRLDATWQARLETLENRLRELSGHLEIESTATKSELDQVRAQLAELSDRQSTLVTTFDVLRNEWNDVRAGSVSHVGQGASSRRPSEADDDVPEYDSEPLGPRADRNSEWYADDADSQYEDESLADESSDSEEPESDDLLEFQVDDESISLRLSRMLGDSIERRPKHDNVTGLNGVEPATPASYTNLSSATGISPDDGSMDGENGRRSNSVLSSYEDRLERNEAGRSDAEQNDEPDSNPESESDGSGIINLADLSQFQAVESVAKPKEKSSHSASNEARPETGTQEEESIEDYMQRLLQRVRTGPPTKEPTSVGQRSAPKAPTSGSAGGPASSVTSSASASARPSTRTTTGTRTPAKPITEMKSDIEALRELANSNARRAINRSVVRRKGTDGIAKATVTVVAILSGILLFFIGSLDTRIRFAAVGVSVIVALFWGLDALREIRSFFAQRNDSHGQDEPKPSRRKRKKSASPEPERDA
jgi:hypothetical protein